MGVYVCLGQPIHSVRREDAVDWESLGSMDAIHAHVAKHGKVLVYLSESQHKIKKKAEQEACELALRKI